MSLLTHRKVISRVSSDRLWGIARLIAREKEAFNIMVYYFMEGHGNFDENVIMYVPGLTAKQLPRLRELLLEHGLIRFKGAKAYLTKLGEAVVAILAAPDKREVWTKEDGSQLTKDDVASFFGISLDGMSEETIDLLATIRHKRLYLDGEGVREWLNTPDSRVRSRLTPLQMIQQGDAESLLDLVIMADKGQTT